MDAESPQVQTNAASAAADCWQELVESGRWQYIEDLCAPNFVFDDRRKHTIEDRDQFVISSRLIYTQGTQVSRLLLATLGERLALDHICWIGITDGSAFETETYTVWEVNSDGRLSTVISFAERHAARDEMYDRLTAKPRPR